jgi:hypothetical protein
MTENNIFQLFIWLRGIETFDSAGSEFLEEFRREIAEEILGHCRRIVFFVEREFEDCEPRKGRTVIINKECPRLR